MIFIADHKHFNLQDYKHFAQYLANEICRKAKYIDNILGRVWHIDKHDQYDINFIYIEHYFLSGV